MAQVLTERAEQPAETPEAPAEPTPAPQPVEPSSPQAPQTEPGVPTESPPAGEPDGNGGAGTSVTPTPDEPAPPESQSDVPPPLQVECAKCGHMNLLTPDAAVYPLAFSSRYITCDECLGQGRVATGSLVAGKQSEQCPVCKGSGYRDTQPGAGPPAEPTFAPVMPSPDEAPPWAGAHWDVERRAWV